MVTLKNKRKKYMVMKDDGQKHHNLTMYVVHVWISFTVVAILALTVSGVGMDSCPESPGGHIYCFTTYYTFYYTTIT